MNSPGSQNPPKNQLEALDALDKSLERLRLSYEKYFRGIERRPPVHERMALEREVREFFRSPPRTAAARFRFSNFRQRMTSFETYWNRVMRQIEEGTYERDVRRARMRVAAAPETRIVEESPIELDLEMDLDFDMDELFREASESVASLFKRSAAPATKVPPLPPAPPAPPAEAIIGASSRRLGAPPPAPPPHPASPRSKGMNPEPPVQAVNKAPAAPPMASSAALDGAGLKGDLGRAPRSTPRIPPVPPVPPAPPVPPVPPVPPRAKSG